MFFLVFFLKEMDESGDKVCCLVLLSRPRAHTPVCVCVSAEWIA